MLFDTLGKALCNAQVLASLDPKAKYCLHVDAGQYALGASHSQARDKTENIVGYFSRELHDAETQYPASDRELLGIHGAILNWKFNLHVFDYYSESPKRSIRISEQVYEEEVLQL